MDPDQNFVERYLPAIALDHFLSFFFFFFFKIFDFQILRIFFVFVNMGAKLSKRYFSHNFGLISTKLYGKYVTHVGIWAVTFLVDLP